MQWGALSSTKMAYQSLNNMKSSQLLAVAQTRVIFINNSRIQMHNSRAECHNQFCVGYRYINKNKAKYFKEYTRRVEDSIAQWDNLKILLPVPS